MNGTGLLLLVVLGVVVLVIALIVAVAIAGASDKTPRNKKRAQGYYTCPYCPASFASPKVICPRRKSRTDPPSIFPPSN